MTGVETAVGLARTDCGSVTQQDETTDPAPVCNSEQGARSAERETAPSPLRDRMVRKVAWWKTLRTLSDEQEAALEFWEEYLRRDVAVLSRPREVQAEVSEPLQRR